MYTILLASYRAAASTLENSFHCFTLGNSDGIVHGTADAMTNGFAEGISLGTVDAPTDGVDHGLPVDATTEGIRDENAKVTSLGATDGSTLVEIVNDDPD